jgi:hypothetical protein
VDLVDEQHVVLFEVGQQRRQVAGRSSTGPEVWRRLTPSSARDDVRQRGLAQPRRAELGRHRAYQFIHFQARHQRQGQLRPHTVEANQFAEEVAVTLANEAIEQLRIFAHHKVSMQGQWLANRRKAIQGGHGHFQLIPQPVDIQNQVRRLFFSQGAAQASNHGSDP